MISVCLCTYNGERYVREQMISILSELEIHDEVIVCDDRSSDNTIEIIENISDSRIRIFINDTNLGHVQNFAKAISLSSGDIIFLSDQDDIWVPGRVRKMTEVLTGTPGALLLASNFELIDEAGAPIGEFDKLKTLPMGRLNRVLGIFIGKMPYFGCTFAFKKSLIQAILPIPKNIESHDIWIALLANMLGPVVNLEVSTLKHRIHGRNMTLTSRRHIRLVVRSRLLFAFSLIGRLGRYSLLRLTKSLIRGVWG